MKPNQISYDSIVVFSVAQMNIKVTQNRFVSFQCIELRYQPFFFQIIVVFGEKKTACIGVFIREQTK